MTDLYQKHFHDHFPRRKTTPTIRANKVVLAKKLQAAVDRGDVTWEIIEEKVRLYAECDTVRLGFIVLPATWCSETNDNGPGWSWEYEIPKTEKEIIAAKPLSERTPEEWRKILGEPTPFNKALIAKNMDRIAGAPQEVLKMYGLGERYG